MELLIVPVLITLATLLFTFLFNRQQNLEERQAQQSLENQRAEFSVYQEYLDKIGNLLLDKETPLRHSHEDEPVQDLARAQTLSALQALSPDRKVLLLEFLYETELIQTQPPQTTPIISLRFADLHNVDLVRRNLISHADLENADLRNADLRGADLYGVNLRKADLGNAKLSQAILTEADLTEANLRGAEGIRCQQTERTESLEGATLPNGQKYEDWRKDKGCGKD